MDKKENTLSWEYYEKMSMENRWDEFIKIHTAMKSGFGSSEYQEIISRLVEEECHLVSPARTGRINARCDENEELIIYRGEGSDSTHWQNVNFSSWTTCLDSAKMFAYGTDEKNMNRNNVRCILQAKVKVSDIIDCPSRTLENEVLCQKGKIFDVNPLPIESIDTVALKRNLNGEMNQNETDSKMTFEKVREKLNRINSVRGKR